MRVLCKQSDVLETRREGREERAVPQLPMGSTAPALGASSQTWDTACSPCRGSPCCAAGTRGGRPISRRHFVLEAPSHGQRGEDGSVFRQKQACVEREAGCWALPSALPPATAQVQLHIGGEDSEGPEGAATPASH